MAFADTPRVFRIGAICVSVSICFYLLMWDNTAQVWGPSTQFLRTDGSSITESVLRAAQALHTTSFICLLLCMCLILTYIYVERDNFIAKIVLLAASFIASVGVLSGTILWGTHRPPKNIDTGSGNSQYLDYGIGEEATLTWGALTFLLSSFATFCFFLHLTEIQIPALTEDSLPRMPPAGSGESEQPVQVVP